MDLNDDQIEQFSKSALLITGRSYETGGITTPDELVKRLKSSGSKRRNYRHYLFGREDQPCYECGTTIVKEQISGRRIYVCESCQGE
jgi:endonuclease-8